LAFTDPIVASHVMWMHLRRLSGDTVELRLVALRSVAASSRKPPLDCTAADLDAWQKELRVADTSRSSYISQVCSFYRWALEQHLLDGDPSGVLVSPQLARRVPRPIAEDDLELALAAAPERIAPWLELAAYAGFRAGEVSRLTRRDVVDRAETPVLVVSGKGNRERIVPMSPRVWDALRYHGLPQAGLVFPRADGQPGPIRPNRVSAMCSEHLHGLGIPATLHQLRHFFGTQIYRESGYNLRLTQELLGHSSPSTTALYTAYSNQDAAEAVAALGHRRAG
jgi:integrase